MRPALLHRLPLACLVLATGVLLLVMNSAARAESHERSMVSRSKADMRMVANALEAYRVDHGSYPLSTLDPPGMLPPGALTTPIAYLSGEFVDVFKVRSPRDSILLDLLYTLAPSGILIAGAMVILTRLRRPDYLEPPLRLALVAIVGLLGVAALVVPLVFPEPEYRPSFHYIANPNYVGRPHSFHYLTDRDSWWLLQSVGIDGDLDWRPPDKLPRSPIEAPAFTRSVLAANYDPTNGTISDGDLFRWSASQFH